RRAAVPHLGPGLFDAGAAVPGLDPDPAAALPARAGTAAAAAPARDRVRRRPGADLRRPAGLARVRLHRPGPPDPGADRRFALPAAAARGLDAEGRHAAARGLGHVGRRAAGLQLALASAAPLVGGTSGAGYRTQARGRGRPV